MNTLSANQISVGMLLPRTTKEVLNMIGTEAEGYIINKKNEIEKKGIKVTTEISYGYPDKIIIKIANKKEVNLIVIGTHGKAGLNAFWSGSIAAKIASKTKTSILFVPIPKE
jgi:nucleotide-binding universal stress UspA family protein